MKAQPSSARMLPEQTILSAWCEQVTQAAKTPALRQQLLCGQHELLPRFAEQYQRLKALPRRVRRGLQRKWKQSLAGVALLLALGQAPALAATINVGEGCSLVDAIHSANTNVAFSLCTAGSGADTIVLPAGSTHTLTTVNNSTPYGPTGLPLITSAITIAGNNSHVMRPLVANTPDFRLLTVTPTGALTLRDLTLTGGLALGTSGPTGAGAGIYNHGALTLVNTTIAGNVARRGGGVQSTVSSTLTLTNSTISGNTAVSRGGGVDSPSATVTATRSTISGNKADLGGGLYNYAGAMSLIDSTVSGNTATLGGGVLNRNNGTLTLTNIMVLGNTASVGGGVRNYQGVVRVTNSTVSSNAAADGGGVYNARGIMSLTNTTVTGNAATSLGGGVFGRGRSGNLRSDIVLNRTLISGNTAPKAAELFQSEGGVVTANNYNLFGHSGLTNAQAVYGFFTPSFADITATSDGTAPTALTSILNPTRGNNGGLTHTHALVPGSPAIDAATAGCPLQKADQRGVPRPQDGNNDGIAHCDIGAFERVRAGTVTCDGLPATRVGTGAANTINGTPGPDVIQGLGGNDVIRGLGGNDVICGGSGNDRLFGGPGEDRLFGGAGTDRLDGELGFDRCDGGPPTGDTSNNCEQISGVP